MVIPEVTTVFRYKNMQRNEMAPSQKKKEIIRYIAVDSLEFYQDNSLITVITLFSPLLFTINLSPQFPVIQFFLLYVIPPLDNSSCTWQQPYLWDSNFAMESNSV